MSKHCWKCVISFALVATNLAAISDPPVKSVPSNSITLTTSTIEAHTITSRKAGVYTFIGCWAQSSSKLLSTQSRYFFSHGAWRVRSNAMSSRFFVSSLCFPNTAVLVDFMQPSVSHQYRFEDPSHLLGLAIPTFTSKSLFSENNGGGAAIIFG